MQLLTAAQALVPVLVLTLAAAAAAAAAVGFQTQWLVVAAVAAAGPAVMRSADRLHVAHNFELQQGGYSVAGLKAGRWVQQLADDAE